MVENGQGDEQEDQERAPGDESEVLFSKVIETVNIGQIKHVKQEKDQENTGLKPCNSEDGDCSWVMMIVELEDESVGDFVLFVHVHIEAKYPDVKDEDGDSAPSGEVSGECAVLLQSDIVNDDDHD